MKNEKDMIKWLNNLKSDIGQPQHSQLWHYAEILDVIAKYLESATTTDCISREWLKGQIEEVEYENAWHMKETDKFVSWENIENAPSFTPTERTGEWIPVTKVYRTTEADFPETHIEWETATEPDEIDAVRCSECGEVFDFEDARNWCTECGAKMKGGTENDR